MRNAYTFKMATRFQPELFFMDPISDRNDVQDLSIYGVYLVYEKKLQSDLQRNTPHKRIWDAGLAGKGCDLLPVIRPGESASKLCSWSSVSTFQTNGS